MPVSAKRMVASAIACCFVLAVAAPALDGLDVPLVGADKAWAARGGGKGSNGKGGGAASAAGGASASSAAGAEHGKSAGKGKGIGRSTASTSSASKSAKGKGGSLVGEILGSVFGQSQKAAKSSSRSAKGKGRGLVGEFFESVFGGPQKTAKTKTTRQKQTIRATVVPTLRPQHTPKASVRQYALANGLKQGKLASALKSWNSLNRNVQAYINNMNNPNSLPGLQVAYIRETLGAETALESFVALGGNPDDPPTEAEAQAAQEVLDAQALLGEEAANPGTYTQEEIDAAQAVVDAYAGDPQEVVDQFEAWSTYQTAEEAADDAFLAASVSYRGGAYDEEALAEVRSHVDGIIEMKGLDTLVAEFDEAAAEAETATAEAPLSQ